MTKISKVICNWTSYCLGWWWTITVTQWGVNCWSFSLAQANNQTIALQWWWWDCVCSETLYCNWGWQQLNPPSNAKRITAINSGSSSETWWTYPLALLHNQTITVARQTRLKYCSGDGKYYWCANTDYVRYVYYFS